MVERRGAGSGALIWVSHRCLQQSCTQMLYVVGGRGWAWFDHGAFGSLALSPAVDELLVEVLASALLLLLDAVVLVLVLVNNLSAENLLNNGPLPLLAGESAVTTVSSTSNDGADLRELGHKVLASILLEVLLSHGDNLTHSQNLQISLQLGGQIRAGHVKPIGASVSLGSLFL